MVVSVMVQSRCVFVRFTFLSNSAVDALKLEGRLYALHEGRFLYLLLRCRIHYRVLHWMHTLLLYVFEHVRSEFFLRISYCSIEAMAVMLQSILNASCAPAVLGLQWSCDGEEVLTVLAFHLSRYRELQITVTIRFSSKVVVVIIHG